MEGGKYVFSNIVNGIETRVCVLMPMAGGEIESWLIGEIGTQITRANAWKASVKALALSRGLDQDDFLETAWKAVASAYFDYQGLAIRDDSPTRRFSFTDDDRPAGHDKKGNGDWDEPSYVTLDGVVVSRSKITNLMYAVWGRTLGYSTFELELGAFANAWRRGVSEGDSSQNAISLGGALYDAHVDGSTNDEKLDLIGDMSSGLQTPDTPEGLNDVNLFPEYLDAQTNIWLPTMPTDYDSLDGGESEAGDRRE